MNEHAIYWIIGYFCFSAVVGGMVPPDGNSSVAYRWAYSSLHILAGNLTTAVQAKFSSLTVPAGTEIQHKETTTVTTPQ